MFFLLVNIFVIIILIFLLFLGFQSIFNLLKNELLVSKNWIKNTGNAHEHYKIALALKLTFLIFSMVLNCMGIIILQLSDENISYNKLGFLESFKDIPIAFIPLFAINFISRMGTEKSIILALFIVVFAH